MWLEPSDGLGNRLPVLTARLSRLASLEGNFARTLLEEKLAAMAEFAAGAGHEINNPLAIIGGRAQLLLKDEPDPERRYKAFVRLRGFSLLTSPDGITWTDQGSVLSQAYDSSTVGWDPIRKVYYGSAKMGAYNKRARGYLESEELSRAHGAAGRGRAETLFRQELVWQRWAEFYKSLVPVDVASRGENGTQRHGGANKRKKEVNAETLR